ncbi:TfoX/Sxy family protein [Robiginitalea sp. SC105]|uniref:TfoX/Sxy family protein n=1 Tax=Robiginitalea sp. SC105 TaxID=2762332 RepID=UPI00163B0425|nr:TfoX/Sxy family protein [Robiginitalea sp. SC105]MBC2840296.1 TfoX/Sxy family protein [Robiginitalea sp. SC105]
MENRLNRLLMQRGEAVQEELTVKYMFGGLAYMYRGKMSVGIVGESLMARVPATHMTEALLREGARPMDFTGRTMKEFVFVDPEGFREDTDMNQWIDWGLEHARSKSASAKPLSER